jgi:hypothetical protein
MVKKGDREGLSLLYRIVWRIRYIGMHMYGPAQLDGESDPHERLKRERQQKVDAARRVRRARQEGATE